MKQKIFITLILTIFLFSFVSSFAEVELIAIGSGEMVVESENYITSIIIETPSGITSSQNYETQIGFLYSTIDFEPPATGEIKKEEITFAGIRVRTIICIVIALMIIILIALLFDEERKKKKKNL